MSEDQTAPVAQDQNTAPVEQPQTPVAEGGKKDSVAYETYRKALKEKANANERLQETQARLEKLEAERQAMQQKELEAQNRFKELYESVRSENEGLKKSIHDRDLQMQDALKIDAFQSSLGDKKIDRKYFGFVDTAKIMIDPETGTVDELSAQKEVERVLAEYPEIVRSSSPAKPMPTQAPQGVASTRKPSMHDRIAVLAQHLERKHRG